MVQNEVLNQWHLFQESDFPFEPFTGTRSTPGVGVSAVDHLAKPAGSRVTFMKGIKSITIDDWSRLRKPAGGDYSVSPRWVVLHFVGHKAGHRFKSPS